MGEVSRKEIVEIFNRNQLSCDEYVTPSIKEWNKIGAHIDKLTAQVGELAALIRMQQGWLLIDPDYRGSPLEAKANELLTRIGEDNE